jgi:hypothetical protein
MARRHPVASGALLICLLTAEVAALGGQSHEPAHQASPAPTKSSTTKPPDVSAIVERIQKRIDEEVVKPAAARAGSTPRKPAVRAAQQNVATPPDGRIRLQWRVSLIWPEELVAER